MSGAEDEIIIFNVGGKRFETRASTIDHLHPQTGAELLNMLVRQRAPGAEIFIDREPRLFRWILYAYRTNIVPAHTTVGVEPNIWHAELLYFGLVSPKPERKRRATENPLERTILDWHYRHHDKLAKAKQEQAEADAQTRTANMPKFQALLHFMVFHPIVCFVGKTPQHNGPIIRPEFVNGQEYDVTWLISVLHEFDAYAKTMGYEIRNEVNMYSSSTSYEHLPASRHVYTKHAKVAVTLKCFYSALLEDE